MPARDGFAAMGERPLNGRDLSMPEETAPTTGTEETTTPTEEASKFDAITSQEDFDKAIQARIARERAKFADYDQYKVAASKLAEIEEASKTEAQKSAERLAELEGQVKSFEQREQIAGWKAEVAEASGVPASVLSGSTREEIEAHAEALKPLIAQTPGMPVVPTEGTGSPRGGVSQLSKNDLESMSPEQINKARREGRLNKVLGIT